MITQELETKPRLRTFPPPEAEGTQTSTAGCSPGLIHVTTVPATLKFLRGQIRRMKDRGFDVRAISSPGPALGAVAGEEGIPVQAVNMERKITPLADLGALGTLFKIFRILRPRIVHGHTPKGGLLAMIAAFLARVPVRIYTLHGLPMETTAGVRRMLLRWTERVSCALAHRIHVVSHSLAQRVLAEKLAPRRKLFELGEGTINGVDATGRFAPGIDAFWASVDLRQKFSIPSHAPLIGFVGRVVRDKGLIDLVRAWQRLRSEFPDAHLIIVGTFEPQDPIPTETEHLLRTDPRIHLAGHIDAMAAVYSALDILALPTYREGFPQVVLEAAAMECPVVATRVTGCVDAVVDGVTGILVPPRSPEALAAALGAYLRDPELRTHHGRAARTRALQDFRPEKRWEVLEAEYRQSLRRAQAFDTQSPASRIRTRVRHSRGPSRLFLKRIIDIAIAAAGLAATFPILILLALAIRVNMGSPVLFLQRRPGLKGTPFTLFKFRSMHPKHEGHPQRIGGLGRFLRKTSLDELPQFWNVLRGEMSLVGPRPLMMEYLECYTPLQMQRHEVKPGLTGLAQIGGRNSLTWEEKFALDLEYIRSWSLPLDFKILLKTLGRVFHRKGIEGPGNICLTDYLQMKRNPCPETHAPGKEDASW